MARVDPSSARNLRVPADPRGSRDFSQRLGGAWRPLACLVAVLILALLCPALSVAAPPTPVPVDVSAGYGALEAVACPLTSQCTGVGFMGAAFTFDPLTNAPAIAGIPSHEDDIEVACPSATQCSTPYEPTGISTFDPTALPAQSPAILDLGSLQPQPVAQIACASPQLCVTVSFDYTVVAFDPRSATGLQEKASAGLSILYAVACASVSECVVLGEDGTVRTFDPASDAVSAPSEHLPALSDYRYRWAGLACPAVDQCTAFYTGGKVVTFNPQLSSALRPSVVDVAGGGVNAIACPAVSQCTLVDNDEGEVTFNPITGVADPRVVVAPNGGPIPALSCPSSDQCTVVDAVGDAVTFDPAQPSTPIPYSDSTQLFGATSAGSHARPRMSFSLLSGDQQPGDRIAAFTLALPSGFRVAPNLTALRGSLTLTAGGHNASAAVHQTATTLRVTLHRPALQLGLILRFPGLVRASSRPVRGHVAYGQLVVRSASGSVSRLGVGFALAPPTLVHVCLPDSELQTLPLTATNPPVCF